MTFYNSDYKIIEFYMFLVDKYGRNKIMNELLGKDQFCLDRKCRVKAERGVIHQLQWFANTVTHTQPPSLLTHFSMLFLILCSSYQKFMTLSYRMTRFSSYFNKSMIIREQNVTYGFIVLSKMFSFLVESVIDVTNYLKDI